MLRLRSRRALLLVVLLLGAAVLSYILFSRGCASRPSGPQPEVEYAGCRAVLMPGPVCVPEPERLLRLWVGVPPGEAIEIEVDGRRVESAGEPVHQGRRFLLPLAPGAKQVEVHAGQRAAWSLRLTEPASDGPRESPDPESRPDNSHDVLTEIMAQALGISASIEDRDLAAVRAALAGLRLPPQPVAQSRYLVSYYRGVLAEKEGDYRSAMRELQDAIEIAERVRLDRFQWLAEQEMGLVLLGVGRSRDAAQLFERLRGSSQARNACEEGQLLSNLGWSELRAREAGESSADPVPLLEEALAKYATCNTAPPEKKGNVLINLALAHLQAGRLSAANQMLAKAREIEPHPPVPHRLWWLDMEGRIALRERPVAALRWFAELADLATQTGSFDGRLRALFGQARAQRALGDRAAALETLVAAESLLDEESLQIPMAEGREAFVAARQSIVSLHLELLLEQGRIAEALEVARLARSRVLRQLAQVDRLASLPAEQRARRSRLLTDYQQTRASLEARARDDWKLPADERRHEQAAWKAEAESASKLLDEAFMILGEPTQRSQVEPVAPHPGELVLAYHPLADGWVGFASNAQDVVAHRFDLPPEVLTRPTELASRLLVPFRAAIERAQRLRILASGRLENVDFHALPFGGDVLLAGRPVVYGLDLTGNAATAPISRRLALLVADPRGDLPGALDEAREVRKMLESGPQPWVTEELQAADASADAVRRRLAAVDLLHYAGHGSFSGFGGWESSLLLAEDTQLILGDLLALEALPTWVVLSGCDTGRSAGDAPVASLGLAHAFLLAGSRVVVASTRPADDRKVPAFFALLYQEWGRDPDLSVALQRAELAWREQDPSVDWSSFRLFEP